MANTETTLCNYALAKIGGGGLKSGSFKIDDIDGTTKEEVLCKSLYAQIRDEVLCRAYWQEATKYADLGDDLKDNTVDISSVTVADSTVTIVTSSAHGKSTGDIIYLLDIDGTGGITALNGGPYTITVSDTTTFTLQDTTGSSSYSHTADTGEVSDAPESADWEYAFALPSDYLGRCKQIPEDYHRSTKDKYQIEYDHKIMQGFLFTNECTNTDGDSAYIKYVFGLTDVTKFSTELYNAIATKLAAELAGPLLVDKGERRLQLLKEYESLVLPIAEGENQEQSGSDDYGEYTAITCRTT